MKQDYNKLLRSPEWKAKRQLILNRDNETCTKCGSKSKLHVHHIWYIPKKLPWQVPNSYLTTLCDVCHLKEHEGKSIKQFILTAKKRKQLDPKEITKNIKEYYDNLNKPKRVKKNKPSKNQNTIKKLYATLSKEDKLLQAKYDAIKNKKT